MGVNLSTVIAKIEQVFTITDELTSQEIVDAVKASLYIDAVKWKLQQRKNILARHLNATTLEYRTRHELAEEMNMVEPFEYIAVYLNENPETTLDGEALEQAAKFAWGVEMNSIDAEINTALQPMMLSKLSQEWATVTTLSNAVTGVDTDIKNLLKAAVQIDWK